MSPAQEIIEILNENPEISKILDTKFCELCLSDVIKLFCELCKEKKGSEEEVALIDFDEFINKKYDFDMTSAIKTKISSAVFRWCIIDGNGKMWLKPNQISEKGVLMLYKIGEKTIKTLKMMLKDWGYAMLP